MIGPVSSALHRPRVALELRAVAPDLAIEERLWIATLVRTGLEIDDPALSVGNERAIERHALDRPGIDAGDRVFAAVVVVAPRRRAIGRADRQARRPAAASTRVAAATHPARSTPSAASSTCTRSRWCARRAASHCSSPSAAIWASSRCATVPTAAAVACAQSKASASSAGATHVSRHRQGGWRRRRGPIRAAGATAKGRRGRACRPLPQPPAEVPRGASPAPAQRA